MKNAMLTIAFAVATTTMFAAQNPPAQNAPAKLGTPAVASSTAVGTKKPVKKTTKHSTKKPVGSTSTTPAASKPVAAVKPAPASK